MTIYKPTNTTNEVGDVIKEYTASGTLLGDLQPYENSKEASDKGDVITNEYVIYTTSYADTYDRLLYDGLGLEITTSQNWGDYYRLLCKEVTNTWEPL